MSTREKLGSLLPPISPFHMEDIPHPLIYVGAAGFEDRAMAILENSIGGNIGIEKALAIEYKPYGHTKNRVEEFNEKLGEICESVMWVTYNRRDPQEFQNKIQAMLRLDASLHILVDISALSKFLTMLLLQSMRKLKNKVSIVYAEADIYHPTREEFEKEKARLGATPDFLTTGIYDILTVPSLSSVSMQGYPILLLVFPTFNHFEIVALYNEISPQFMILLEGNPHEECDKWRLQAIREINRNFIDNPDYVSKNRVLSTFDYISNVEALEEIYRTYSYHNKILLAPTGSKLQTIATFLFKQLHPDVQIVYPVTQGFRGEYSEKVRALWSINVGGFSDFIYSLGQCGNT